MTLEDFRQSLSASEPPAGLMVGCQGRLEAGSRVGSAGRGPREFVGARLPAPQGRRSEQCKILVRSGWQARLPGNAGCGVDQHCDGFAVI
jgi:hypothetical protein